MVSVLAVHTCAHVGMEMCKQLLASPISVFRRAGRELYESGKVTEALECLRVAVEKEENAVTLTNLGTTTVPCTLNVK